MGPLSGRRHEERVPNDLHFSLWSIYRAVHNGWPTGTGQSDGGSSRDSNCCPNRVRSAVIGCRIWQVRLFMGVCLANSRALEASRWASVSHLVAVSLSSLFIWPEHITVPSRMRPPRAVTNAGRLCGRT